jgi:hypothetical protein
LLAVSRVHPLFTARYVEFSLPALALLCAAALSWLAGAAARMASGGLPPLLAWLPAAVILILLAGSACGPAAGAPPPGLPDRQPAPGRSGAGCP